MNNDRRKSLRALYDDLQEIIGKIDDLKNAIEVIRDEEQEAFDNMPEGLQMGDRGQAMEQAISNMDEALSSLENAQIDDVESLLESACE